MEAFAVEQGLVLHYFLALAGSGPLLILALSSRFFLKVHSNGWEHLSTVLGPHGAAHLDDVEFVLLGLEGGRHGVVAAVGGALLEFSPGLRIRRRELLSMREVLIACFDYFDEVLWHRSTALRVLDRVPI